MFEQELGLVWHLEDIKGNHHQLTFSMDVNDPLVTGDWFSLRVFYKLEHIHQIYSDMLATQPSRLLYSPACLQYQLRRRFFQTYFECEQNIFLE